MTVSAKWRFALFALLVSGCTDDVETRRALKAHGFTDVVTQGYAWTGCGEGDYFATQFRAKNPKGENVTGVVCCGAWKRCTVRF